MSIKIEKVWLTTVKTMKLIMPLLSQDHKVESLRFITWGLIWDPKPIVKFETLVKA